MKNLFKFGMPKTPGFGISASYYLTLAASRTPLPALAEIVDPYGKDGAVAGMGVPNDPMMGKETLTQPLIRGSYTFTTRDKRSVVAATVLTKSELGFDERDLLARKEMQGIDPIKRSRLERVSVMIQLKFLSHAPEVYPAIDFILHLAERIGVLSEAVVADPLSERWLLPEHLFFPRDLDVRFSVRDMVDVTIRRTPDHGLVLDTRGLCKFDLPEFHCSDVDEDILELGVDLLYTLSHSVMLGEKFRPGETVGAEAMPFVLVAMKSRHGQDVLDLSPQSPGTTRGALLALRMH